jgi:hypothetical protein
MDGGVLYVTAIINEGHTVGKGGTEDESIISTLHTQKKTPAVQFQVHLSNLTPSSVSNRSIGTFFRYQGVRLE